MNNSTRLIETSNLNVVIHGRHFSVSPKFKEHVLAKLARVERFALGISRVDVELSHEANPRQSDRAFEIKITSDGIGPFIRATAFASDQYTAFDLAHEKFEEQLRRLHERSKSIKHHRPNPSPVLEFQALNSVGSELDGSQNSADLVLAAGPLHVQLKHQELPVMSVEEAVERVELGKLKFLVFLDCETNLPSLLYPRKGYDYGLMQLGAAS